MKVSNKIFFTVMRWLVIIVIIVIFFDFALSFVPGSLSNLFEFHQLAIVGGVIIMLLGIFRFSYFAFEDEYEIIHIDTRSLVFGFLESPRHKHYEFAKIILADYKVEQGFLKYRLVLTVTSSSGDKKLRDFDLFYLKKDKQDYVIKSLQKVIEKNRLTNRDT
jgi:hypothetical protein